MKEVIFLGLGALFGFLIGHQQTPPAKVIHEAIECPQPKRDEPIAIEKLGPKVIAKPIVAFHADPTAKKLETPPPRQGRVITITSSILREMEDRGNSLAQEIRLNRENDGWSIVELQKDSIFSRAGFIQGDIITTKAIETLRDQEGDLPDRFRRVLSQIAP